MNKNYYQILEVDVNASFEVIEKAYKTLVKKYHPDLQENSLKNDSEEKLKLINEAYEVLSNEEKRKNYDLALQQEEMEKEKIANDLLEENKILKDELYRTKQNNTYSNITYSNTNSNYDNLTDQNLEYEEQLRKARQKAYNDAYIQDLKNRGYKIKYKKTWKDYLKNLLALLITFIILFLLWQIPFIKSFFINLYEENAVIQYIINFIANLSK